MQTSTPSLIILIANWTLFDQKNADGSAWSLRQKLDAIEGAGFEAFCGELTMPGLKEAMDESGLRFAGGFDAGAVEDFEPRIRGALEIGNGPINCQLADHDTPVDEAVELTVRLMEEAERQGAEVHLEAHRDTCTETPEKLYAIVEGVRAATGRYPRVNFDFSHPAIIKHLDAGNYAERLFENKALFQQSTLWHMRPFNGHHCQIPVTDGKGKFSPEYEELRPFIRTAFDLWLSGDRPNNEFWVLPELGPKCAGYGLSCFPDVWEDAIVLGNDLKGLWAEALLET